MIILKKLDLQISDEPKTIYFGLADTEEEKRGVYALRYQIYSERNYIDNSRYPDKLETDEYDHNNKCLYFFAQLNDKIIGTIRFIQSDPLPAEKDFKFDEPAAIKNIPKEYRGELGRLIIIPPNREKRVFLPRGLVMLLMVSALVDYGEKIGIICGYFFVKQSLEKKMEKLGFPVHLIKDYELRVKESDVLYKYFSQVDNPVIPGYFITKEYKAYIDKTLGNNWIFTKTDDGLRLNDNFYTNFLRCCGIL